MKKMYKSISAVTFASVLAASSLAIVALNSCGKKSKKSDDEPPKVAAGEKPIEGPVTSGPAGAIASLDIAGLKFTDLKVTIGADLRVAKVISDASENSYVAVKVEKAGGYMILKYDASGKELWRFPTKKVADGQNGAAALVPESFVDMVLDSKGNLIVGSVLPNTMLSSALLAQTTNRGQLVSQIDAAKLAASNSAIGSATAAAQTPEAIQAAGVAAGVAADSPIKVINISSIDSTGIEPDSPKVLITSQMGVYADLQLSGVTNEADSKLMLHFVGEGNAESALQVKQIVNRSLSKSFGSACYLSAVASIPTTKDALVSVQKSANATLVNQMANKCWDAVGTKPFPTENGVGFVKKQTSRLTDGSPDNVLDMLSDIFADKNEFTDIQQSNLPTGSGSAVLQSLASVVFAGEVLDDKKESKLSVLTNGKSVESEKWSVALPTSRLRDPASMDLLKIGNQVVAAWTDMHSSGETGAGTRSIILASVDSSKGAEGSLKSSLYRVPSSVRSFASVKILGGKTLRVFATAESEDKKQWSLFLGQK